MGKGIDLGTAGRILATAHGSRIITWCFFMVGYPGEQPEDVAATFAFLKRHRCVIDAIAGGPFVLTRQSPLARRASVPGLVIDRRIAVLSLRCDWQLPETMPADAVAAALAAANQDFKGVYPSLPAFVEAHALVLSQADYQKHFVVS